MVLKGVDDVFLPSLIASFFKNHPRRLLFASRSQPKSRTSSEAQPVRRDGVDDYSSLAAIESHFAEADWGYDT